jgi:hypothetical protein
VSRCIHHPGRVSVLTINSKNYCAECQRGIIAARLLVNRHVEPKPCFIWYVGSNSWQPIAGTGCAHWVAHQRGIKRGNAGEQCIEGFPYRVRTMIGGMSAVLLPDVQVNDVYVSPGVDHTGLVLSVTPNAVAGRPATIIIRHDSSGQGGVSDNDFATYFHGNGTFHR